MNTINVERNLSNFDDFHDKKWIIELNALVKNTKLDSVAEEFAAHWLGNARAFVLPSLLVNGVYDCVYSQISIPPNKSRQDFWNSYIDRQEFKMALWKLTENTYCSLYYAYENLLANVLNEGYGCGIRMTSRKDVSTCLRKVYSEGVINKIWINNHHIATAREIRHCVVHVGGKVSENLHERQRSVYSIGDDIKISASDTRKLYVMLKPLSFMVLEEGLRKLY